MISLGDWGTLDAVLPALLILLLVFKAEKTRINNMCYNKMILVVSKILKNRKHL